jgi:hypothetical protein
VTELCSRSVGVPLLNTFDRVMCQSGHSQNMEEATENKCLELVLKEAMSHRNTVDIIVRALQDCQKYEAEIVKLGQVIPRRDEEEASSEFNKTYEEILDALSGYEGFRESLDDILE